MNIVASSPYRAMPPQATRRPGKTSYTAKRKPASRDRRILPDRRINHEDYHYSMDLREMGDRRESRRVSITT